MGFPRSAAARVAQVATFFAAFEEPRHPVPGPVGPVPVHGGHVGCWLLYINADCDRPSMAVSRWVSTKMLSSLSKKLSLRHLEQTLFDGLVTMAMSSTCWVKNRGTLWLRNSGIVHVGLGSRQQCEKERARFCWTTNLRFHFIFSKSGNIPPSFWDDSPRQSPHLYQCREPQNISNIRHLK